MQEYSELDAGIRASLEVGGTLESLCRAGARRMLAETMEVEIEEYISRFQALRDEEGKRLVVRTDTIANVSWLRVSARFRSSSLA